MAGAKPRVGGEREVASAPRAVLSPCVPDVRASVSNTFYLFFGYFEWLPLTSNTETATAPVPPSPLGPSAPSVVPACLPGLLGDSGSERRTQASSGLQNRAPRFPKKTEGLCTSKFEKSSYKESPEVTTADTQAVLGQRTPWEGTSCKTVVLTWERLCCLSQAEAGAATGLQWESPGVQLRPIQCAGQRPPPTAGNVQRAAA